MNEETQKKYMEMQTIQQEVMQLHKQVESLQQQKAELVNTVSSIDELSKVKGEKELLTPVSQGIFIKSKIKEVKELLVNVGSGVIVKKDVNGAKKLVEQQIQEIDTLSDEFVERINANLRKASGLEADIQKVMEK